MTDRPTETLTRAEAGNAAGVVEFMRLKLLRILPNSDLEAYCAECGMSPQNISGWRCTIHRADELVNRLRQLAAHSGEEPQTDDLVLDTARGGAPVAASRRVVGQEVTASPAAPVDLTVHSRMIGLHDAAVAESIRYAAPLEDIGYPCGCTRSYCPTHRPSYLPALREHPVAVETSQGWECPDCDHVCDVNDRQLSSDPRQIESSSGDKSQTFACTICGLQVIDGQVSFDQMSKEQKDLA